MRPLLTNIRPSNAANTAIIVLMAISLATLLSVVISMTVLSVTNGMCNCVNGTNGINGINGTDGATGTFSGLIADTNFTIFDALGSGSLFNTDVQGAASTLTTLATNSSLGNVTVTLQPFSGTAIIQNTLRFTFANPSEQSATDQGSAAMFQVATTKSGGSTLRSSQYGANTGVPGIAGFKSRGPSVGVVQAVAPGDSCVRMTGICAAYDNVSIPIAGLISIDAAPFTPSGQNFVPTQITFQNVPLAGPINGRKENLRITTEGLQCVSERANSMAGVATTIAGGSVLVSNSNIATATRILLTIQDGGTTPTGFVYVSARIVGDSITPGNFTITSSTADVGVPVYWQLYCQTNA